MSLDAFAKEITKTYGKNTITTGAGRDFFRIPTGIFNLDAEIGGGIPYGLFTIFAGAFSGGKSLTALRTASNAQHIDRETHEPLTGSEGVYRRLDGSEGIPMRVLYLDAEGTVSPTWAKTVGVDIHKDVFMHMNPDSLEQTYNIMHGAIRSNLFDLIVLDSIAAMSPDAEREAAAEDAQMALAARGNNRGLRVAGAWLNWARKERGHAPAIILVNQFRQGMSKYDGNILPGGMQQSYASALTVEFRPQNSKNVKVKDELIARASMWKISKSKTNGKVGIEGEFLTYLQDYGPYKKGQTNSITQVLQYAVKLGLVERSGAWFTVNGVSGLQGENQAVDYLINEPVYSEQLKQQVLSLLKELQ